jgi:hypothetical protein
MTTGTFPSDIDILSTGAPRILADGLGSTMAIVDSSGNSQKSYQYGSGSLSSGFDFAGQQTDGTGLQYLRARYYDPETPSPSRSTHLLPKLLPSTGTYSSMRMPPNACMVTMVEEILFLGDILSIFTQAKESTGPVLWPPECVAEGCD